MSEGEGLNSSTIVSDGGVRGCGGCTACCEGWLTDKSMKLFPGSACVHISSRGCGIYESRPEKPCRSFKCAWLTEPDHFPEAMRPDRSGAIPIKDRDWYSWKVIRAFPVGEAVPPETLEWLIQYAKPKAMPIIFYQRNREGSAYESITLRALGPPRFTEEAKRWPSEGDVFHTLQAPGS